LRSNGARPVRCSSHCGPDRGSRGVVGDKDHSEAAHQAIDWQPSEIRSADQASGALYDRWAVVPVVTRRGSRRGASRQLPSSPRAAGHRCRGDPANALPPPNWLRLNGKCEDDYYAASLILLPWWGRARRHPK
jgi:hypothetical protein